MKIQDYDFQLYVFGCLSLIVLNIAIAILMIVGVCVAGFIRMLFRASMAISLLISANLRKPIDEIIVNIGFLLCCAYAIWDVLMTIVR